MKCSKCGAENPDEARFCGKCGEGLAAEPQARPEPPEGPPLKQAAPGADVGLPPVAGGVNLLVILGTIIVPMVGIILGVIYLNDADPRKKSAGKLWLALGVGMMVVWCIGSCAFYTLLEGANTPTGGWTY